MKKIITAAAAIVLSAAQAQANDDLVVVAGLVEPITSHGDVIQVELTNMAAPKRLGFCKELAGSKTARVVATSPEMYPRVLPLGWGCWKALGDDVLVVYQVDGGGQQVTIARRKSAWVKTPNFKSWN